MNCEDNIKLYQKINQYLSKNEDMSYISYSTYPNLKRKPKEKKPKVKAKVTLDLPTGILNVSGMSLRKKFNQGILYIISRLTIVSQNGNLLSTSDDHNLLLTS